MVSIDQYNSDVRHAPRTGGWRWSLPQTLRTVLGAGKYLFRRTDAEKQALRLRAAERISAMAGQPTAQPIAEPKRLASTAILEHLRPAGTMSTEAVVEDVAVTTIDVKASLDRVEYDLAAIRREIAAYMPDAGESPCETQDDHGSVYRM